MQAQRCEVYALLPHHTYVCREISQATSYIVYLTLSSQGISTNNLGIDSMVLLSEAT